MKTVIKLSIFFLCIHLFALAAFAQEVPKKLEVGKPCPPIVLKEIDQYNKRKISISELKGKHVILDFWTTRCPACVGSFKKINKVKNKYGDRLEVILVGKDITGKNGTAEAKKAYGMYREKWGLKLPVVYSEALFDQFKVIEVPYLVWIDDKGIIRALSGPGDMTEDNIESFLAGGPLNIRRVFAYDDDDLVKIDYHKPFLIGGNAGADTEFEFRSVLARWQIGTPMYVQLFITSVDTTWAGVESNRVQANGASIAELVMLAYGDTVKTTPPWYRGSEELDKLNALTSYERLWRKPVLELRDSLSFVADLRARKNFYTYSLIVPRRKATGAFLQQAMRRDLEIYFPYDITVETRSMPCWFLTASESARLKLKTKGEAKIKYGPSGFEIGNMPFSQVITIIFANNDNQPPIIDQTGIEGHVDFKLEAAMMDFPDVIEKMREQGLYLKKGRKDMQVIVVRDRKRIN